MRLSSAGRLGRILLVAALAVAGTVVAQEAAHADTRQFHGVAGSSSTAPDSPRT